MSNTQDKMKEKALAAFIGRKAEIDTALERLKTLSDEHFNADPESINWGHVGELTCYAEMLNRITDTAFREGEHAAE